jgi:hypothetical protein
MEQLHSIPNMGVKRYCGENTEREVFWEDNTMPESSYIFGKKITSLYMRLLDFLVFALIKSFFIKLNRKNHYLLVIIFKNS